MEEIYIEELYKNKRYSSIIKHRNYNPRLISFITDFQKVCDISHKYYWTYIENTLDHPADIWSHVYDNQLDENARAIVVLVVFNGKEIEEGKLKEAFLYLANERKVDSPKYGISDFYSGVKLAVGALINRKIKDGSTRVSYDLFNPAVGDYIVKRFSEDKNKLSIIFESLNTNDSLINISSLLGSGVVQKYFMLNIINHLLLGCLSEKFSHKSEKYIINLIKLSISKNQLKSEQYDVLRDWLLNINYDNFYSDDYFNLSDILTWSLTKGVIKSDEFDFDQYLDITLNDSAEHNDFVSLSALFKRLNHLYVEKNSKKLKELIIEYWEEMVDQNISEDGILDGYFYEGEEEEALESLYDYVEEHLSEYILEFKGEEINSICEYCDVSQHIEDNIANASHEPDDFEKHSGTGNLPVGEDAAIDDLFERTDR